jgi:dTDP-4-amino-4,6-dideoxygalactose transaminase
LPRETFIDLGYNYRMSDIHAAIGIVQMGRLKWLLEEHERIAAAYNKAFSGSPFIASPFTPEGFLHTYQSYQITLKHPHSERREDILQKLVALGIACRRAISPVHLEPYFRHHFGETILEHTESVAQSGMLLPLYPAMSESDQQEVITQLLAAVEKIS